MEYFERLKSELSLTDREINKLKKIFKEYPRLSSRLILGSITKQKPDWVIGGPCIRYDLNGITFNSMYQIVMPIYIASILKVNCLIFLGIQEEIILKPKNYDQYKQMAVKLKIIISDLAEKYLVKVKIVDTSLYRYNNLIEETVDKFKIALNRKDSTYIFTLSTRNTKKKLHSNLRCIISSRVTACHTKHLLSQVTNGKKFMIVEDIEQYPCFVFSQKFDKNDINFLAFIPAPSIEGNSTLFKANKYSQLLATDNPILFTKNKETIVPWVAETYSDIYKLFNSKL